MFKWIGKARARIQKRSMQKRHSKKRQEVLEKRLLQVRDNAFTARSTQQIVLRRLRQTEAELMKQTPNPEIIAKTEAAISLAIEETTKASAQAKKAVRTAAKAGKENSALSEAVKSIEKTKSFYEGILSDVREMKKRKGIN